MRRVSHKLQRSASFNARDFVKDKKAGTDYISFGIDSNEDAEADKSDANDDKVKNSSDADEGSSETGATDALPLVPSGHVEAAPAWPHAVQTQVLPVGGPLCIALDAGPLNGVSLGGLCLEAEVPSMLAGLLGFPQFQHQLYAAHHPISSDASVVQAVGAADYWNMQAKAGGDDPRDASHRESNPGWDWGDALGHEGFERQESGPGPGVLQASGSPQAAPVPPGSVGSTDGASKNSSPCAERSSPQMTERGSVAPHILKGVKPPQEPSTTKGRPRPQLAGRQAKNARGASDLKPSHTPSVRTSSKTSTTGTAIGTEEKKSPTLPDRARERSPRKAKLLPVRRRRALPQTLSAVDEEMYIYQLAPSVERGAAVAKLAAADNAPRTDGLMTGATLESSPLAATTLPGSVGEQLQAGDKANEAAVVGEPGADAGGASQPESRQAMARDRSFKLLSRLDSGPAEHRASSSAGRPRKSPRPWTEPVQTMSPRKGQLAPLPAGARSLEHSDVRKPNTSDSTRTLATVQTLSTTAGGTASMSSLPSSQKLTRGSPSEAARLAQITRLRERRWDASFATRSGSGIPSLSDMDSGDEGDWPPGWAPKRRANTAPTAKRNLINSDLLSWGESQELAANWALALASSAPSRPTTGPASTSYPGMQGLGATEMSSTDMSLAYHSFKDCLAQEYVEWHGSALHEQYMATLHETLQNGNQDDPQAGGSASLRAIRAQVEDSYLELRELLQEMNSGADVDMPFAMSCQKYVEALWRELQVSQRSRRPGMKRAYAGQTDQDMARATGEHAQELLNFRDATVRIIGVLVERDHLTALAGQESRSTLPEDDHAGYLSKIDEALSQGVTGWCANFGHFAQLGDSSPWPRSQQLGNKRSVFLWCGQDVLESIRSGTSQVISASSSTSGLLKASPFLGVTTEQPMTGNRLPGFRCQERAARSGNRALRSLLRGGDSRVGRSIGSKFSPQSSRPSTSPWTGNC